MFSYPSIQPFIDHWTSLAANNDTARSFYSRNQARIDQTVQTFFCYLKPKARKTAISLIDIFIKLMIDDDNLKYLTRVLYAAEYAIKSVEEILKNEEPDVKMGYRLHLFFYAVEALKLGQTLGAYDKTPYTWREGLMLCNSTLPRIDRPLAEEIFKTALPKNVKQEFGRNGFVFGGHLGSGQYVEVYELLVHDDLRSNLGIPIAVKLTAHIQIPGAPELVAQALDYTLRVLKAFGDIKIGPVDPAGLIPLIKALQDSMPEETNFTLSEWKNQICARQAQEITMDIKNIFGIATHVKRALINFDFGVAYFTTQKVRITKRMLGENLDTLSKLHGVPLLVRIMICVAMWMYIFARIACGKHLNHDMHARNFKFLYHLENSILHIRIGMFDELALVNPPLDADKTIYGHMLMDGIGATLVSGIDPDSALANSYFALCRKATRGELSLERDSKLFAMLKSMITSTHYQLVIDRFSTNPAKLATIYISMIKGIGQSGLVHRLFGETVSNRFKAICLLHSRRRNLTTQELQLKKLEEGRRDHHYPKRKAGLVSALISTGIKSALNLVFGSYINTLYSDEPSAFVLIYCPSDDE